MNAATLLRLFASVLLAICAGSAIARDDARGTDADVRAACDGDVAYFGAYGVDAGTGVVVHHADGNVTPGYTGTDRRDR